jgi:hypothetical protein
MSKKFPVQPYNPAIWLRDGTCEVTRVEGPTEGTETLCVQLFPDEWNYSITVNLGDTGLEPFAPGTPWEEILKQPVDSKFKWLGKNYKVSIRLDREGTAVVELRESLSSRSFRKTPFASFRVALAGAVPVKPEVPGAVYAVSVASYYEDNGTLTTHCAVFSTPEKAADWFETDWNDQAGYYGGRKLAKKAKKAFLDSLKGKDGVAEASGPDEWGAWFKWKGVRTEI